MKTHKFGLTREDESNIGRIYTAFHDFGPEINYNSGAGRGGGGMPNYVELMTATDLQGEQRSYLASEENYRVIRDLERRNLVVPLTGDFGGRKAIRTVGQYLKDHGATVTAFYLSNVERYLFQGSGVNQNGGWTSFYNNVADAAARCVQHVHPIRRGRRARLARRHAVAERPRVDAGNPRGREGRPHSDLRRRVHIVEVAIGKGLVALIHPIRQLTNSPTGSVAPSDQGFGLRSPRRY